MKNYVIYPLLLGIGFFIGSSISFKDNDYRIYEDIDEELGKKSEMVIDTISVLFPGDLKFGKDSKYVGFSSKKWPGYITVWYTSSGIVEERSSFGESDFYMYLIPVSVILGGRDDIVSWLVRKHRNQEIYRRIGK